MRSGLACHEYPEPARVATYVADQTSTGGPLNLHSDLLLPNRTAACAGERSDIHILLHELAG